MKTNKLIVDGGFRLIWPRSKMQSRKGIRIAPVQKWRVSIEMVRKMGSGQIELHIINYMLYAISVDIIIVGRGLIPYWYTFNPIRNEKVYLFLNKIYVSKLFFYIDKSILDLKLYMICKSGERERYCFQSVVVFMSYL